MGSFARASAHALHPQQLRAATVVALLLIALITGSVAQAQVPAPAGLPSFAELEAAGATVGEIRVVPLEIFDTNDPAENHALFRLANRLHIPTREGVIRRAILFQTGEQVSVRLIEETERLLRSNR